MMLLRCQTATLGGSVDAWYGQDLDASHLHGGRNKGKFDTIDLVLAIVVDDPGLVEAAIYSVECKT